MDLEGTFIILFVIAMAVAIAVPHLRLAHTVGLVLTGLPPGFPFRDRIVSMTFGVVTLSILGHGPTMLSPLGRLGIVRADTGRGSCDLPRGGMRTAVGAPEEIERVERARERIVRLARERGHLRDRRPAGIDARLLDLESKNDGDAPARDAD